MRYLGIPASGVTTTAYRTVTEFTATASQTTFTPASYTPGFINVYQNGALLGSADYTATNGTTVVLAVGATAGDLVVVESFYVSSVLNAIPALAGAVSTSYIAAGAVTPSQLSTQSQYTGFKNRIINGAMVIDQRNAGASVTPSGVQYINDRWAAYEDTDGTMTFQQSSTVPAGFLKSIVATTTSADSSLGATQRVIFLQRIEGFNVADLNWGTANAQTVTLSFWVRSSLTGTFGGSLGNVGTRSYPFTYTISAANTFEYKTITIAGDTTGTWDSTNGSGIQVCFGLGVGTTYSGTANAWAAADYNSATGATSVIGTNGATWYLTGVQLEKGSTATSFDYRPYGTELALCQRYFYKTYNQDVALGTSTFAGIWSTTLTQSNQGTGYIETLGTPASKVTMRASPTITVYDRVGNIGKASYYVGSSVVSNYSWTLNTAAESGFSWYSDAVTTKGGVTFHYTSSAEL